MKKIFLIMIGFSIALFSDFSRSFNGIVTDNSTGLEWQDDYSDNGGDIKKANWIDSIDYCEKELTLDGGGWRLPNINELTSIMDDTKYNPSINNIFENTKSYAYWSSTSYYHETAWSVVFYSSTTSHVHKSRPTYYVRCVRGGE